VYKAEDLWVTKLSAKGQVVIPERIRRLQGFKKGDRFFVFPSKEDGLILRRYEVFALQIKDGRSNKRKQ